MSVLLLVLLIGAFVAVDVLVHVATERMRQTRLRREREKALDIGLRLEFTHEARSLKRVEVESPRARILAVDDEAIVLDSFRKILVLAGYGVDTVETGKEAVGLVQKNAYDFVFTDLKMPEMDGLEVTKAVKHFRPDVDVIIITGYATVQSAVDAMKFGAMDYVQKPFTEEELVGFVNGALIRRQDRIERQTRPKLRLVTPSAGPSEAKHEFNVPAGLWISPSHAWVSVELTGLARIGVDDFVLRLAGPIDSLILPDAGSTVRQGDVLFSLRRGRRTITIPCPVGGKVVSVNAALRDSPDVMRVKPYELGWVCCVEPTGLSQDLRSLRVGGDAVAWYQEEVDRFMGMIEEPTGPGANPAAASARIDVDERIWDGLLHLVESSK